MQQKEWLMAYEQMFDGEGVPVHGPYRHGENAYDRGGVEFKYSDKGEEWMLRSDFERKYEGGGYPLG